MKVRSDSFSVIWSPELAYEVAWRAEFANVSAGQQTSASPTQLRAGDGGVAPAGMRAGMADVSQRFRVGEPLLVLLLPAAAGAALHLLRDPHPADVLHRATLPDHGGKAVGPAAGLLRLVSPVRDELLAGAMEPAPAVLRDRTAMGRAEFRRIAGDRPRFVRRPGGRVFPDCRCRARVRILPALAAAGTREERTAG